MVDSVTTLGKNGVQDWIIQRVSAVIIGLYVLFIIGFFFTHPNLEYDTWRNLFDHTAMVIATFVSVVAIVLHAWVGLWTVITDYIKPKWLSIFSVVALFIALGIILGWSIRILWG